MKTQNVDQLMARVEIAYDDLEEAAKCNNWDDVINILTQIKENIDSIQVLMNAWYDKTEKHNRKLMKQFGIAKAKL